jgi:adenosine kinase
MALGVDAVTSAKLGAVSAAYALEHLGGQSHAYTWQEFQARYVTTFGPQPLLE